MFSAAKDSPAFNWELLTAADSAAQQFNLQQELTSSWGAFKLAREDTGDWIGDDSAEIETEVLVLGEYSL
jgi:hypothetical protein